MCKVNVLLYHRVMSIEDDLHQLAVSKENFYTQMKYLKENYHIIKFDDDWSDVKEPSVVVTFDDGYCDNYENAFPILESLQVPATIFVTTGVMNQQKELWWDDLERILLIGNEFPNEFVLKDDVFSCKWSTRTLEERRELYFVLHWLMYNKISLEQREDWFQQLYQWKKTDATGRSCNSVITELQCKVLDKSPYITVGAHTVNHPSLKYLTDEMQKKEICVSKKKLEDIVGHVIDTFSYPFGGKNDYNASTVEICREVGFKKVAANYAGIWTPETDELQVPRNIVRNWNLKEFQKQLEMFWRQ